jgi:hypothetical protein
MLGEAWNSFVSSKGHDLEQFREFEGPDLDFATIFLAQSSSSALGGVISITIFETRAVLGTRATEAGGGSSVAEAWPSV